MFLSDRYRLCTRPARPPRVGTPLGIGGVVQVGEERAGESARKAVRRVERAREEEPQRARVLELVEGDWRRRERPAHPVLALVRVRVRVRARTRVRVRVRVGLTLTLILTLTLTCILRYLSGSCW